MARPANKSRQISLFPILLVNFIGTLGFSIVLPFLVTLVTKLGGNALVYGLMGATYSTFQLIGAPILGRWSDIYGRRKILLLSQLGTLVSWIVFLVAIYLPARSMVEVDSTILGTFVLTLPLLALFIARALDGLTGGNVSVANAYLADVTGEEDRSTNFGRMAVAANLGFIVGPALAGLLGATAWGETIPILAALLISLIASLVIALYLPESRPSVLTKDPEATNVRKLFGQEQRDCFELAAERKARLRDVFTLENIPYLLILNFLIFLAFNIFYTAFPVHAVRGLSWSITEIGFFFSFLGLTMVLAQGPVLSRLSKKCSDVALVLSGSVVLGTGFALLVFVDGTVIYLGGALFSLGNGLMWPTFLSTLSKVAGKKHQGSVQGFSSSVGSLASVLGLIVGGVLYGFLGRTCFLLSAAVIYLVALMSLRLMQLRPVAASGSR